MLTWIKYHETVPGDTVWVFYLNNQLGNQTGDVLLGTVSLVKSDRQFNAPPGGWVLGGFNVKREFRGQGYGEKILQFILQELHNIVIEGHPPFEVFLNANPRALSLYEKLGWKKIETNNFGIFCSKLVNRKCRF